MPAQNHVVDRINYGNRTDVELLVLLKNCHERFDSNPSRAEEIISLVNKEFKRRQKVACSVPYLFSIRQIGVLKAFGYEVGDGGITDYEKRKFILDVVVNSEIPPIDQGSPGEFKRLIKSWGDPQSRLRIRRLINKLERYVHDYGNYKHNKRARSHWLQDIAYLEANASEDTFNIYGVSH